MVASTVVTIKATTNLTNRTTLNSLNTHNKVSISHRAMARSNTNNILPSTSSTGFSPTKGSVHPREQIASVHLSMVAFNMVSRDPNSVPTMPATHKDTQDTSEYLFPTGGTIQITYIPSSGQPGYDQYGQQQQYQESQQGTQVPLDPNGEPHQFAPQSSDRDAPNYDPNAPPMSEGERGLLGSIGGGVAGHMFGKKTGHGFLGTVGGAILGNLAEDMFKDKKKKQHNSSGGSSWGGSKW